MCTRRMNMCVWLWTSVLKLKPLLLSQCASCWSTTALHSHSESTHDDDDCYSVCSFENCNRFSQHIWCMCATMNYLDSHDICIENCLLSERILPFVPFIPPFISPLFRSLCYIYYTNFIRWDHRLYALLVTSILYMISIWMQNSVVKHLMSLAHSSTHSARCVSVFFAAHD